MPEDRASSFLQIIRRSQRGRLKIYLGYGPGVGKTFQMLSEGQRLRHDADSAIRPTSHASYPAASATAPGQARPSRLPVGDISGRNELQVPVD